MAALLVASLAAPAAAQSVGPFPIPGNPFGDPIQPPRPVVAGSGADDLLGLEGPGNGTWLGTYGTGPYSLDSHLGVVDLEHQVQGQWAAYLWSLVVWIARVLVALLSWAFTVDLFTPLAGVIDGVVSALSSSIWRPLIIPTIVLVGLWGAWRGIVLQEISALAQGWLWMVAAVVAGIFFFAQPTRIATTVNTFAAKLSNTALGAVAAVDPGLCEQGQGKCVGGSAHLEQVTDRLWYLYVIKPYVVMEFGDGDREQPYLRRLLDAKTITREDLVKVGQGNATPDGLIQAKAEQYRALVADLQKDGDAFEWFAGRRNYERGMIAGMALVAVIVGGIVLGVIAAGVLLAQLGLLLLFLLAPVFLALGIHPGLGRVIATRWGQLSLGMVIKRVGLSILLAVLLVVSGNIMTAADSAGGWYAAVILHVLLGIAALLYRKPFLGLLALAAPAAPVPRIQLREHVGKVTGALGLGFAYTIGRQAVMQKSVQYLTTRRTPPSVGGGGGAGPAPVGPPGPRGPLPGGGGRALTVGPSGTAEVGSGGGVGPAPGGDVTITGGQDLGLAGQPASAAVGGRGAPSAAVASMAAAGAVVAGAAVAGGGWAGLGAGADKGGARGAIQATTGRRTYPQVAETSRPARRDLHVPYERDEHRRIVEPERRRRRPTPAERMQAERVADGMARARDQRRAVREQQRWSE